MIKRYSIYIFVFCYIEENKYKNNKKNISFILYKVHLIKIKLFINFIVII